MKKLIAMVLLLTITAAPMSNVAYSDENDDYTVSLLLVASILAGGSILLRKGDPEKLMSAFERLGITFVAAEGGAFVAASGQAAVEGKLVHRSRVFPR
jgi:hypothetical protein